MRYGKRGLGGSLALTVVLGALALSASVAQAGEVKGDWKLNPAGSSELLQATETIDGKLETEGALLVLELNMVLKCSGINVQSGSILPLASGVSVGHAEVIFTGCWLWNDEAKPQKICGIENDDESKTAETITSKALFKVVRTAKSGTAYVLAEPTSGPKGSFATFWVSEDCPIWPGDLIALGGTVVFQLGALEAVEQLVSVAPEAIQLLFADSMFYGIKKAHLTGSALVLLTGKNKGRTWGVEAGN